jgi:hypothetical protein
MHYLCLVYRKADDDSERDSQAEAHALVEALVESGYDISVYTLAPPDEASSLRRTGDGIVLEEGPVTTGSARLQSVYVLRARDLNDAVRLAAWLPEASEAEIEIRPIKAPPRVNIVEKPAEAESQESASPTDQPVSVSTK